MIYFITFGTTHNYQTSLNRIRLMAENSGFFDRIIVYTEKDFDHEFYKKYKKFMDDNTGYGFWIWKSYFVKKTFEIMDVNDIMVYADAGCSIINTELSMKKFKIYINLIKSHKSGSLGFQIDLPEELYTKSAIFKELDCDSNDYRKSGQVMATIFFLRKCPESDKLIKEFYNYSQQLELINNDFNKNDEIPTFKAPRNDQSIFSLLRKKHGSLLVPDTTWVPDFNTPQAFCNPILATRVRLK